jgi:hypothetical protein
MRTSWMVVVGATMALVVPATPVTAQIVAPPHPGDFVLDLAPVAPPAGDAALPTCDPTIESLAEQFMAGQTSVTANCTYSSVASQQRQTGTVSNPTLATRTGDAGFNRGTVEALCDVNLTSSMAMTIALASLEPNISMTAFSGQVQEACAFSLTFTDAARSTVTGTIEANARLGKGTGSADGETISIDINAKVYVTGGTGAFAGQTGSGTFNQTEEIDVPVGQGGTIETGPPTTTAPDLSGVCADMPGITECSLAGVQAWCATNASTLQGQQVCGGLAGMLGKTSSSIMLAGVRLMAGGDVMKLRLTKKPGAARILSPAPPPGRATASAKVTAKSTVRVAATAGSVCTVTTNRGVVVGRATARGRQPVATITPKASAYRGASSLVASCALKGQKFSSNRVKISL